MDENKETTMNKISTQTVEPVTTSGWYERMDGSVGRYVWTDGRLSIRKVVPSWEDVPSREDELAASVAAGA